MRAEDLAVMRGELNRRRRLVFDASRHTDAEIDGLRQSGTSAEVEEGARLRSDEDALLRLGDAERLELQRIDAALARMEEGTYGACADCGEEIEVRRLKALPHAVRCQGCEEAREQVGAR
ncbi:MAG TPA: TraR/DksA family transcriptional regulator [Anaeromyxobacteraceae bacterium]|nr:TraR/DksA family transcriptional regulator [Anaeromyxobacteraceae bacterium]